MLFFKWIFKIVVAFFLILSVIAAGSLAFIRWDKNNYVVPIVMYHSINYSLKPDALVTSPEKFDYHLSYFRDNGYNVLSMDELVEGVRSKKEFSKNSVVITFDDGYEDNYTYALPILKKYGYEAVFFIPSEEVGQKGYLSWPQIREMIDSGMDIGGHAKYVDSYLPEKTSPELYKEIKESKSKLESNLNYSVDHFAYPIGGFNEQIKNITEESGFISASTTNRGFDPQNDDVYELNRIRLSDKDNKDYILWSKLSGYYNFLRKPKNPY